MIYFDGLTILAARPSPTNIFAPASTPADSIHELYRFVLAVDLSDFLGCLRRAPVRSGEIPEQVGR